MLLDNRFLKVDQDFEETSHQQRQEREGKIQQTKSPYDVDHHPYPYSARKKPRNDLGTRQSSSNSQRMKVCDDVLHRRKPEVCFRCRGPDLLSWFDEMKGACRGYYLPPR
jgi:hypothetical protein